MRVTTAAAIVLLCAASASAQRLRGVVDLAGAAVDPFPPSPWSHGPPTRESTSVLIFVTTDCPISNRYAPVIKRLAEKYDGTTGGFSQFWLVFPATADNKDPYAIRQHLEKFDYGVRAIRDTAQSLVKLTGVTVSPEVAVVDPSDRVVYRGRIDDRYLDLGRERPAPTTNDLEEVLRARMAGKYIAARQTQAVGCFLADLTK